LRGEIDVLASAIGTARISKKIAKLTAQNHLGDEFVT
jgi:hypothetical protein